MPKKRGISPLAARYISQHQQPPLNRIFPPDDNSVVSENSGVSGDNSAVKTSNLESVKGLFSTGSCGKVCGKA